MGYGPSPERNLTQMMWNIKAEVLNAASKLGINVIEIPSTQAEQIRASVVHRFTSDLKGWPQWIWEHAQPAAYAVATEGWRWIGDFSPSAEVIMLFALQDEGAMYQVPDGKAAEAILSDCIGFEVYFTNRDVDYLLGQNHHDCVFACGTAKDWLEQHKLKLLGSLPPYCQS
jgi:hypothetical protein